MLFRSIEATPDQIAAYEKQASLTDDARLQQIAEELTETESKMRYALSVRTLLEMSLIRCSRIATTASLDDILRRLNAIRTAKPAALTAPAPESAVAKPAFSNADLYDDPALKSVLQEFDGKIVGVEDDSED